MKSSPDSRSPDSSRPPAAVPAEAVAGHTASLTKKQWRDIVLITLGAIALYAGMRALPTGTNLHAGEFRVQGEGALEMCDPSNPQFVPVISARSPVTMNVEPLAPGGAVIARPGDVLAARVKLALASGKPLAPNDFLTMHTRKLHLLIVDPTLTDYQHVHPEPTKTPGEWVFDFKPVRGGAYRVFADFTPVATGRTLYASDDLVVTSGAAAAPGGEASDVTPAANWETRKDGYVFKLTPKKPVVRATMVADLTFDVSREDGGEVPMEPVMGAYAHLVAFDEARSGFAHLHPNETDLDQKPDARAPKLTFKITIPQPGRYVIWAQVQLGGREIFAPFWFDVAP